MGNLLLTVGDSIITLFFGCLIYVRKFISVPAYQLLKCQIIMQQQRK